MKTNRKIWKRISLILFVSIITALGFLISCEKENIQPNSLKSFENDKSLPQEMEGLSRVCGEVHQKNLLLENGKRVGKVYIYNDTKYVYAYIFSARGWSLKNAYLFAGLKGYIPSTREGNPDVHSFNHIVRAIEWSITRRFKFLLSELPPKFVVALMVEAKSHVAPVDANSLIQKTWADGKLFGTTEFGRVFNYTRGVCLVDTPVELEENE